MRNAFLLTVAILGAGVLAGCGGGGGGTVVTPPPSTVTRYITGFVYVKGDGGGGSGPDVVVTSSSNAPTGYFAPDSGVLRVSAPAGGDVTTRSADYDVDMTGTAGNNFILKVTGPASPSPQVTFTTITAFSRSSSPTVSPKTLSPYSVSMGTTADNNTTLVVASTNDFTYTPTAPAALRVTVDGHAPTASETFISGQDYALAAAVLDANGVAITGVTPTFASVGANATRVSISGGTLTPAEAPTAETEGSVTVEASIATEANLLEQFTADFSFGTATSVTLTSAGNKTELLWDVTASAAPLDTLSLTGTVYNQNNVAMPGASVTFSETNTSAGNWNNANGTAFVGGNTGSTDNTGSIAMTFNAPAKKDAVLSGTDKGYKGSQTITLTSGSANNTLDIFVLRPLASITALGPSRVDVGSTNGTYNITGGLDVDNDSVAISRITGPFVWTVTPTGNGGGSITVGDPDDQTARSVATSTSNGSVTGTMQLTAGTVAGQVSVSVSNGTISSNSMNTEVYGKPAKLVLSPAPTVSGYHGTAGFVQAFTVGVIDSFGHSVTGETTFTNKLGSTDSLSGANIDVPLLPDLGYTVTAGSSSGTFSITMGGSWTGANGGTGTFNISRTVAIAIP